MTHTFRLGLLAIAAATALALTACGSSGDDTTSGGSGSGSGSGSGGSGGGTGTVKQFTEAEKTAIVDAHNKARDSASQNAVPPATPLGHLAWDDALATIAAAWSANCNFVHSHNGYGENLWMGTAGAFTVTDAVAAWVNEGQQFVYGTNNSDWGHYTQIVLESATKVGCGWATCPSGNDIMTCNYDQIQSNYSTPYTR